MRYGIVLMALTLTGVAQAQWKNDLPPLQIKKTQGGTICYHKPEDSNLIIPPPAAYEAWKRNPAAKTNATTFEVTYVNFSAEAQAAFQKAVDIWSTLIESPVPIRILAVWQPLSGSVLGGASPGTYIRDFDGAQKVLTWYPVALAEKMAGRGRVLLRKSGTEPLVRVMVEGDDAVQVTRYAEELSQVVIEVCG